MAMVPTHVRPPAVAGTFYPSSPRVLDEMVHDLLEPTPRIAAPCPKAILVPHAGYVYSGPTAARAYARLAPYARQIERVVLIGPAHRVFVEGVVSPGVSELRTPLGDVPVDLEALALVPMVTVNAAAHAQEHCLEVQLPFLQVVAPHAKVVPLLVGNAKPELVGAILDALWGGPETVLVVSSDLSHFLSYDECRVVDHATAAHITALDPRPLCPGEACGAAAVNGLVWVARKRGLHVHVLDLRSSGDTAGSREEVVGYGAFALEQEGGP
ncbi:MAG: AmmeMemoRadiSam system protein B [Myxococcales bacterium]|nr:AmmeMemoRadiSam system protein B [Myxococcales bacterium]